MLNKEKCTKLLNHVIYLVGYGFGELNYWNIVGYIFDEYWYMGPSGHFYSDMGLTIRDI